LLKAYFDELYLVFAPFCQADKEKKLFDVRCDDRVRERSKGREEYMIGENDEGMIQACSSKMCANVGLRSSGMTF
jgi:hypothetical protein